jgi:hypothetical protein
VPEHGALGDVEDRNTGVLDAGTGVAARRAEARDDDRPAGVQRAERGDAVRGDVARDEQRRLQGALVPSRP